jgi:hypothetical protein
MQLAQLTVDGVRQMLINSTSACLPACVCACAVAVLQPLVPNAPEDSLGISPHKDAGFLTVLVQDSTPGLQVRRTLAAWVMAWQCACCMPFAGKAVVSSTSLSTHSKGLGSFKKAAGLYCSDSYRQSRQHASWLHLNTLSVCAPCTGQMFPAWQGLPSKPPYGLVHMQLLKGSPAHRTSLGLLHMQVTNVVTCTGKSLMSQATLAQPHRVPLLALHVPLQVLREGQWYTVQPVPGALTINVGDMAQVRVLH